MTNFHTPAIRQLIQLNADLMDSDENGQERWTRAGDIGRIDSEACETETSWSVVFANGASHVFDASELNDSAQCTLIADGDPGAEAAHAAIDAMKGQAKLQQYHAYIAKLQSMGKEVTSYECPECKGKIKTQVAPAGDKWDTISVCPHCDEMHLKITEGARARAVSMP